MDRPKSVNQKRRSASECLSVDLREPAAEGPGADDRFRLRQHQVQSVHLGREYGIDWVGLEPGSDFCDRFRHSLRFDRTNDVIGVTTPSALEIFRFATTPG